MELKDYQIRTLDAFTRWRNELAAAQARSETAVSALMQVDADIPPEVRNYPKTAWQRLAATGEVAHGSRPYLDRTTTTAFPIPHTCLKVPTGGGKTLLAAC